MRHVISGFFVLGAFSLAAGCTNIPALEDVENEEVMSVDFPTLAPLDSLIVPVDPAIDSELEAQLTGRAERLRDRADRIAREGTDFAGE